MKALRFLALATVVVALGAGAPEPGAENVAFDQIQVVHDCGYAPKNCDAFFGPAGFERAYKRMLKVLPGGEGPDSLPGEVFRFAYYGSLRRVEEDARHLAIVSDSSKNDAVIMDTKHRWYVRPHGDFLDRMNREWSAGRAMRNYVNPVFWMPAEPTSRETSKLPDQTIGGLDSRGRRIAMTFKWNVTGLNGAMRGRAEERLFVTLYQAYGINEPCPTFHMGVFSLGGPAMGFCWPNKATGFVTYFYRYVPGDDKYGTMYPQRLVVERGHIRRLGLDDANMFRIPDGFRDVCTISTTPDDVDLHAYC